MANPRNAQSRQPRGVERRGRRSARSDAAVQGAATIDDPAGARIPVSSATVLASLAGVSKRYGRTIALDGIDLEVRRGELVAVLGPNGAGKTTAISMLLGIKRPDSGLATLFGEAPQDIGPRRNIGVMMQEVGHAPELTVRELVRLTSSYYPNSLPLNEAIAASGVGPISARSYGKLSGGQKRLAQFALAICGRPKLVFLDEPTTHLDMEARETLWKAVREIVDQGTSVFLTTHYIEEAEALADRVVVVAQGRSIGEGSVNDIRGLVVRKYIDCVTSLSAEEVREWPEVEGVNTAERAPGRMRLTTGEAEAVVRRLLTSDASLQDLEVRRASLADALKLLTRSDA